MARGLKGKQRRGALAHLLGGQQADVDEVPVIGHQRHHFKCQVGPWVLGRGHR